MRHFQNLSGSVTKETSWQELFLNPNAKSLWDPPKKGSRKRTFTIVTGAFVLKKDEHPAGDMEY